MKSGIHPRYVISTVTCACGNSFVTRSVKPEIKLDICAACHPFFTGKQKLLDTAGRVEKFQKRFAATEGKTIVREKKAAVVVKTGVTKARSLKTTPHAKPMDAKAAKAAKKSEKKAAKPDSAPAPAK